jgi:hypothetical protein
MDMDSPRGRPRFCSLSIGNPRQELEDRQDMDRISVWTVPEEAKLC